MADLDAVAVVAAFYSASKGSVLLFPKLLRSGMMDEVRTQSQAMGSPEPNTRLSRSTLTGAVQLQGQWTVT